MSENWIEVGSLGGFDENGMQSVVVEGTRIGLFLAEGKVFALNNICTHGNACLTDGTLDGYEIECPLHAGFFDIRNGKAMGPPLSRNARSYRVRLQGEAILIDFTTAEESVL